MLQTKELRALFVVRHQPAIWSPRHPFRPVIVANDAGSFEGGSHEMDFDRLQTGLGSGKIIGERELPQNPQNSAEFENLELREGVSAA